ncbi:hypothetical protein AN958_00288 [Leucoagaricus sp. SymC.cos]|nr:hypothetical protein AN958_00288 [Leucoagaricus sp. SymC.cos]
MSFYILDLFAASNIHSTFHISCLKKLIENYDTSFPSYHLEESGPTLIPEGMWKHVVERIINECRYGQRKQYLV